MLFLKNAGQFNHISEWKMGYTVKVNFPENANVSYLYLDQNTPNSWFSLKLLAPPSELKQISLKIATNQNISISWFVVQFMEQLFSRSLRQT